MHVGERRACSVVNFGRLWQHERLTFQDEEADEEQGRSGKRIKLSPPKEQKSNFLSLVLSSNGQHLVGVTGEDKCLRVFRIDSQSRLHQLSER
jgi:tRNA (guanine-N(7)-)-methyltransferase subunit TRM82